MSSEAPPGQDVNPDQLNPNKGLTHKEIGRRRRAEERATKRRAKAEAKLARKQGNGAPKGVGVVGKQRDAERKAKAKARVKAKGVAQPPKRLMEDKDFLRNRTEKLREKAQRLLKQADETAALYQKLVDEEKAKREARAEAGEGDDFLAIDSASDDDASDGNAPDDSDDSEASVTKPTDDEIPPSVPADEILLKHRRLSNAASERSNTSKSESNETASKPKKSKKQAKQTEEEEEQEQAAPVTEAMEIDNDDDAEKTKADKKAKKAEKKRKRDAEADAAEAPVEDEPASKKEKKSKDKKEKKEKKNKDKKGDTEQAASAAQAEQWHVDELDGGDARQAKFLRLLGGKKAGGAASTVASTHKDKSSSTKAEADIQRQFEVGMMMKNDGGSKRRGLGA